MTEPSQPPESPSDSWPRPLRFLGGFAVLRHRNYRLLWGGQVASGIGQQFQQLAIGWHLYLITDSTLALGLTGLFRVVPFMTLSLVGGAVADSMDRRKLLVVTQSLQVVLALFLVATVALGIEEAWPIYLVSFLGGAFGAFDGPARQAMVPSLVPRAELTNALTLNTLVRQAAMIVGPSVGGIALAAWGAGPTFAVNAATHGLVLVALLAMTNVHVKPPPATTSNVQRIMEGLAFSRSEPLILLPLLLDFVTRFLGGPRGVLPALVKDVYGMGPEALGALSTAGAVGGILGGLFLGSTMRVPRPVLLMMAMYFFEGLSNGAVGIAPSFLWAWLAMAAGGVCNVVAEVIFASIIQLRTPDHLRGRTTSLTNMLALGGPSAGQFEIGVLASYIGPGMATLLNGVAGAGVTIAFGLLPGIRRHLTTPEMTALVESSEGQRAVGGR